MSGHKGVHHQSLRVGVAHLPTLVGFFSEAAHWIALAQGSHIVTESAYANTGMIGRSLGAFIEATVTPDAARTMHVVTDPVSDAFAADLLKKYLNLLAYDPVAATAFAWSVAGRRKVAIERLVGLEQIAKEHDQALARSATEGMVIAKDVMVVSGILFAAGICVLSLGILPALVPAVPLLTNGVIAYGASTAMAGTLAYINPTNEPHAMQAFAVDLGLSTTTLALPGYRMDVRADRYKELAKGQRELHEKSIFHAKGLQRLAGQKSSSWLKQGLLAKAGGQRAIGAAAKLKESAFSAVEKMNTAGSRGLAVIGFAHDAYATVQEACKQQEIISQGNDN